MAGDAILHCWLLRPGPAGQEGGGKVPRGAGGTVRDGAEGCRRAVTLVLSREGASGGLPSWWRAAREGPWVKVRAWALAVRSLGGNGVSGPPDSPGRPR